MVGGMGQKPFSYVLIKLASQGSASGVLLNAPALPLTLMLALACIAAFPKKKAGHFYFSCLFTPDAVGFNQCTKVTVVVFYFCR